MRYAEDLAYGCPETECSIYVHHVLILTVHAKEVKVPLHHNASSGRYFYDAPDGRGGYIRTDLKR